MRNSTDDGMLFDVMVEELPFIGGSLLKSSHQRKSKRKSMKRKSNKKIKKSRSKGRLHNQFRAKALVEKHLQLSWQSKRLMSFSCVSTCLCQRQVLGSIPNGCISVVLVVMFTSKTAFYSSLVMSFESELSYESVVRKVIRPVSETSQILAIYYSYSMDQTPPVYVVQVALKTGIAKKLSECKLDAFEEIGDKKALKEALTWRQEIPVPVNLVKKQRSDSCSIV